jgi:hypothetical protein
MKAWPSTHDSFRVFHVCLEIRRSLSAESSGVKNLFGQRVTHVNVTLKTTTRQHGSHIVLCGVFKNKRGTLPRLCGPG